MLLPRRLAECRTIWFRPPSPRSTICTQVFERDMKDHLPKTHRYLMLFLSEGPIGRNLTTSGNPSHFWPLRLRWRNGVHRGSIAWSSRSCVITPHVGRPFDRGSWDASNRASPSRRLMISACRCALNNVPLGILMSNHVLTYLPAAVGCAEHH